MVLKNNEPVYIHPQLIAHVENFPLLELPYLEDQIGNGTGVYKQPPYIIKDWDNEGDGPKLVLCLVEDVYRLEYAENISVLVSVENSDDIGIYIRDEKKVLKPIYNYINDWLIFYKYKSKQNKTFKYDRIESCISIDYTFSTEKFGFY